MHQKKIIMGIDPGTRTTGYGIIQKEGLVPLDFGCIRPPAKLPLPERYLIIYNALNALIEKFTPDAIAIETQFVNKNVESAIKLGMARGMAILAAAFHKIPIFEYAPKKAKLATVGTGSASKAQVQNMVKLLLKLNALPSPEDAADGLAIAICHAHFSTFDEAIKGSGKCTII